MPSVSTAHSHPRRLGAVVAAALLALPAASAAAQAPTTSGSARTVDLAAGVSQYDLSGTGNALHLAFRGSLAFTTVLIGEASLGYTRYEDQAGDRTSLIVPELQLQAQLPLAHVAPYLGAGIGVATVRPASGGTSNELTLSVSGGARIAFTGPVSIRPELRVRGIGTGFEGSAAEWTLGISWRL